MTIAHQRAPTLPQLVPFVEQLWFYEGDAPAHTQERRLPDGSAELVIPLRDAELRDCVLSGAHSEFTVIDTACLASVIGVHFRPGGASPFLPLPAAELHNTVVPLDGLWGAAASDLRDQLLEAPTVACQFSLLEQFLATRLALLGTIHPAVAFALREFRGGSRTIAEVAEQIGHSQRWFIQVFRETVGLTPKQFCRVQRFQEALSLLECEPGRQLADVALSCGYYDQAHFIHDFRAFSDLSPLAYLARRSAYRNHVPLFD